MASITCEQRMVLREVRRIVEKPEGAGSEVLLMVCRIGEVLREVLSMFNTRIDELKFINYCTITTRNPPTEKLSQKYLIGRYCK